MSFFDNIKEYFNKKKTIEVEKQYGIEKTNRDNDIAGTTKEKKGKRFRRLLGLGILAGALTILAPVTLGILAVTTGIAGATLAAAAIPTAAAVITLDVAAGAVWAKWYPRLRSGKTFKKYESQKKNGKAFDTNQVKSMDFTKALKTDFYKTLYEDPSNPKHATDPEQKAARENVVKKLFGCVKLGNGADEAFFKAVEADFKNNVVLGADGKITRKTPSAPGVPAIDWTNKDVQAKALALLKCIQPSDKQATEEMGGAIRHGRYRGRTTFEKLIETNGADVEEKAIAMPAYTEEGAGAYKAVMCYVGGCLTQADPNVKVTIGDPDKAGEKIHDRTVAGNKQYLVCDLETAGKLMHGLSTINLARSKNIIENKPSKVEKVKEFFGFGGR